MQVEFAGLQQRRHLEPCLIHAAPVDPLNRQALEDDVLGEVQRDRFRGQTEERDSSAAANNIEGQTDSAGMADHHTASPVPIGTLKMHVDSSCSSLRHRLGVKTIQETADRGRIRRRSTRVRGEVYCSYERTGSPYEGFSEEPF